MSSDKKISGFTRPDVNGFVADIFFSTLESVFIFLRIRCRTRRIRVDGSRIRNEKVADSKISVYVWTGPKFYVENRRFCLHVVQFVLYFSQLKQDETKKFHLSNYVNRIEDIL